CPSRLSSPKGLRWSLVMRSKIVTGFVMSVVLAGLGTFAVGARDAGSFRVAISFPAARSAQPIDGRVLLFISDEGRTEPRTQIDPATSGEIKISMDQEVPSMAPPKDTKQVKYIRLQNDRLTKFWGRPMHLGAIVLLPSGWDTHPDAHYPLLVHHGHFPSSMEG